MGDLKILLTDNITLSLKSGARHSASDQAALQQILDLALKLGAKLPNDGTDPEPDGDEGPTDKTLEDIAPAKSLDLSYVKSLNLSFTDPELTEKVAVKSIGTDKIQHYITLWGDPQKVDVEREFFNKSTDFWDRALGKSARPLTWDHMQDPEFKGDPIIGKTVEYGDDDLGRWAVSVLDRAHRYRKMIDKFIEAGTLGSSSDTAPQYVVRERAKSGATYLKVWPWLATALTPTPAEPRMIGSIEPLKGFYGLSFPEAEALDPKQVRELKDHLSARISHLRLFTE